MVHPYTIDVNVCKNDRCNNLGVKNAPEYISPSYYLGFPALHCSKCGSNALLLDNNDINSLLHDNINLYLTQIKNYCPNCFSQSQISYGKTQQKTPRIKCTKCNLVFSHPKITNKQQEKLLKLSKLLFTRLDFQQIINELKISYSHFYRLLKQLDSVCKKNKLLIESANLVKNQLNISTKSRIFSARGSSKPTQLWGITSSISDSGYILLNSLNCTNQELSASSLYDSQQPTAHTKSYSANIATVISFYEHFTQRKSFDQLIYHSQSFENNKKEKIVEPVICAYVHFYELKQYYVSKQTYHYLEHEIVLRSAAITSYSDEVSNEKCAIFYLYESPVNTINKVSIINKHKLGWWKNEWYVMMDDKRQIHRLLGLLTSQKKSQIEPTISTLPATFAGIDCFYQMFEQYFPPSRLAKLTPSNIQLLLNIFTSFYNFCLSDHEGKTTAQKSGFTLKRLTFEEMLDSSMFK